MKATDIHTDIEAWMAGALCGSLSAGEQELFDRHLAQCESCRSLYREEQIMNTILEKEMAALRPEPEFGEEMVTRFRERVSQKPRGTDWPALLSRLSRLAWARPAQALYAVLLLAAMVKTGSLMTGERFPLESGPAAFANIAAQPQSPTRETVNGLAAAAPATDEYKDADESKSLNFQLQTRSLSTRGSLSADAPAARDDTESGGAPAEPFEKAAAAAPAGAAAMDAETASAPMIPASPPLPDETTVPQPAATPATDTTAPPTDDQRKLIRNATVQYEVADYAKAADTISTLIAAAQGFVSTQNSDRGPNGKMEGAIEVKVPPEHLDAFLINLRVLGDLKSQALTTEDVTKDYFDTDARMRTAQQEEARLLDILNKDTGKLSEVLQVERELARVRQQIEQMQGALKYYNTMVRYATVSIALSEKDVNAPAQFLLKQRDDLAIYSADVDATFARAKAVAASAKAQITDSNVQRDPGGQTTATLSLLIDPGAADAAIAQLKALGRIQNFTSATQRVAQDGTGTSDTARTELDKVEAHLTILQDQETAVQQTSLNILAPDVESRLEQLKKTAATLGAEIKAASFQRDPSGAETAAIQLRMPLHAYPAVLAAVETLGDVKNLSVQRQEGATVTDTAPAEMSVQLHTQPRIISPDAGLWATIRRTLAEAFGALMWSVRMIGVSLAFFAPWLLALAALLGAVKLARRLRRKSE